MEASVSRERENLSQNQERKMSAVVQARDMICAIPITHADTKLSWLRRAGSLLGLNPSQAKKIYYREVKRIDADTFNRMRDQLDALKERALQRRETLNDLSNLIASARSLEGSGDIAGDRSGASPFDGRSDGKGEGGICPPQSAASTVSGR